MVTSQACMSRSMSIGKEKIVGGRLCVKIKAGGKTLNVNRF